MDLNSHCNFVISSVGALRPAMEAIGQYPWMLRKYPRIPEKILKGTLSYMRLLQTSE